VRNRTRSPKHLLPLAQTRKHPFLNQLLRNIPPPALVKLPFPLHLRPLLLETLFIVLRMINITYTLPTIALMNRTKIPITQQAGGEVCGGRSEVPGVLLGAEITFWDGVVDGRL
jgi:hypothetical protein